MSRIVYLYILMIYVIPFTVIGLKDKYYYEWIQLIAIFSGYFLGYHVIHLKNITRQPVNYTTYCNCKQEYLVVVVICYIVFRLSFIHDVVKKILSGDYFQWALANAIGRYSGVNNFDIWYQNVGTIFFIAYCFLLGSLVSIKHAKSYYFILLVMLLIESSTLARAGVVIGLSALATEYIVRNNYSFSQMRISKLFYLAIIGGAGLLLIFLFSAYLRVQNSQNIQLIIISKINSYTLAQYEALYKWMQYAATEYEAGLGFNTFTAVYKILGEKVIQGYYLPIDTHYGLTNIFTNIRGFISDFGIISTSLMFVVFGVTVEYFSYNRMGICGYFLNRTVIFLLLVVIYSPFIFTTVFLGYIVSFILMIPIKFKRNLNSITL